MKENNEKTEKIIKNIIGYVGSINSIIIHTLLFIISFSLCFIGVPFDRVLLILTTIVSLEAIYLSLLIQISVNIQSKNIEEIHENVEDLQENVEELQENVEDLQDEKDDDKE